MSQDAPEKHGDKTTQNGKRRVVISLCITGVLFTLLIVTIFAPLTRVQELELYYDGKSPWQDNVSALLFIGVIIALYDLCLSLMKVGKPQKLRWKDMTGEDRVIALAGFSTFVFYISWITAIAVIAVDRYQALGFEAMVLMYITVPIASVLTIVVIVMRKKLSYRAGLLANLVVLLALGLPAIMGVTDNVPEPKILPSEASGISALRQIQSAQELYYSRYGCLGNLADLSSKKLIDPRIGSGTTHGYRFEMWISDNKWSCIAVPTIWGETHERSYRIDKDGIIYRSYEEKVDIRTGGKPIGR